MKSRKLDRTRDIYSNLCILHMETLKLKEGQKLASGDIGNQWQS